MNIIRQSRVYFVCVILAVLPAGDSLARDQRVTPGDLAAKAAHVAIVRCSVAQAVRHESGLIFTRYEFESVDRLGGKAAPDRFQLRIAGGTIGHTRVVLHHMPRFETGRYYVVFLRPRKDGAGLLLAGSAQGVYPARPDPESGQWQVAVARKNLLQKANVLSETEDGQWIGVDDFRRLLEEKGGAQ